MKMSWVQIGKLLENILDSIIPPLCVQCGKEGSYVCSNCQIDLLSKPVHQIFNKYISTIFVLCPWNSLLIRKAVHKLKFRFAKRVINDLRPIFPNRLKQLVISRNSYLIPVPLHNKRLNERGFNQSEILAELYGDYLDLPVISNLLKRIISTSPQSHIKHKNARYRNLKNAFIVNDLMIQKFSDNCNLILVDDVFSTGATLNECAKVLIKAGFNNIQAIVLASNN